jgi:hypothetical protein
LAALFEVAHLRYNAATELAQWSDDFALRTKENTFSAPHRAGSVEAMIEPPTGTRRNYSLHRARRYFGIHSRPQLVLVRDAIIRSTEQGAC